MSEKIDASWSWDELKEEIERLRAYANHERSLGAEGPMIELTQARQKIESLRVALRRQHQAEYVDPVAELRRVLQISQDALEAAAKVREGK